VTTVIMNRPAARNAVNGAAAAELYEAFDEFDKDDSAAVAVLWGDNGTFCAGADLKALGTPDANPVHRTGPAFFAISTGDGYRRPASRCASVPA
jgi:enoyl-CoA hydratase